MGGVLIWVVKKTSAVWDRVWVEASAERFEAGVRGQRDERDERDERGERGWGERPREPLCV
jgi:hypothetical protein